MKEYTGDRIRNVAIVGHGGAGTTSVTEALLYRSGAISRMCKVEDGATTTDYEPEEIKRGVSVNATLAPVEWRDTKINFIDTPGFTHSEDYASPSAPPKPVCRLCSRGQRRFPCR